jgi:hypothetical protein
MKTRQPLFRNRVCSALFLSAVIVSAAFSTASAESWLFDFGSATTATTNGVSPDDPVNFWNNVTDSIGTSNTGSLLNLVTTTNAATPVDLFMVSRFGGVNTNGTLASTLYPIDATRDSFYGNTGPFQGSSNITPIFKISSLDPLLTYSFKFYASRTGATDNRETVYTVSGSVSGSAALNASNNVNSFTTVSGIVPSAGGEITISLTPGPNNNNNTGDDTTGANPSRFIYLGVMEMQSIPEPATTFALGAGALLLAARRRRAS